MVALRTPAALGSRRIWGYLDAEVEAVSEANVVLRMRAFSILICTIHTGLRRIPP